MSTGATHAERALKPLTTGPRDLGDRPLLWALPAMALAAGAGVLATAHPELALSIVVAAGAAIAIALNPLYALLLILLLRASFADTVFVDAVTAVGGVIALAAAAPRLPLRWVTVPLALLLLFALPSVPLTPSFDEGTVPEGLYLPAVGLRYADYPSVEFLEWLRLLTVLSVGGIAAWAVRSRGALEMLVAAILLSAFIPCITGLEQLASGDTFKRPGSGFEAIRGPFTHPNYFAFYLVVVVTIGTVAVLEARSQLARVAAAVPLALASVCLVLTYTRAAWIGLAAVLFLLAVLRDRRLLAGIGIVLVIASIAFPAAREDVEDRFGALGSTSENGSETDNSWDWRTGQWERMLPHGSEHPLTGEGFGSYSRVTIEEFGSRDSEYSTVLNPDDPLHSPRGFSAHNDYVKMYVEGGLTGLLLWVAVLAGMVVAMLAARRVPEVRGWAEGALALAIALAVMAASDNLQAYTAVLVYSLAFFGGIAGAARGIEAGRRRRARPRHTDGPTGSAPRRRQCLQATPGKTLQRVLGPTPAEDPQVGVRFRPRRLRIKGDRTALVGDDESKALYGARDREGDG